MRHARNLLIIFFGLPALFAVLISCDAGTDDESADSESYTPIAGYQLEPRDLSRIVRVSSTVDAERPITISSRMDGLVTGMNVREGDRLSAGEVMASFDVEEQSAELDRARAELELAEARYERSRQLLDQEAVSRAEYEESRAEARIANSEVNLLETRLGFGSVRAPKDLVILERYVEEGDAVSMHESLFRVADLEELVIRVGIPERDVIHLNEGDSAEFSLDAFPGRLFNGSIQRIYPSADSESRLVTVEVALDPEQKDVNIRPGYLARVKLDADRREGILAVPSESLLASDRQEPFVYIINAEERLERRNVETGIERRNWTEILSGLEEGDVIVGGNPGNLREEILVTVTRWVDDDSPETASR